MSYCSAVMATVINEISHDPCNIRWCSEGPLAVYDGVIQELSNNASIISNFSY